jgi:hypothetical protein
MGYEDAQAGAHMRTAFRNAEKHYKRYTQASSLSKSSRKKVPPTDLHEVLDIRKIGAVLGDQKCSVQGVSRFEGPFDWAVYTLDAHPGWSAFLSPSIAFGILAHKRMLIALALAVKGP